MTQRLMTAGLPYSTPTGIAPMRWTPPGSRSARTGGRRIASAWHTLVRFLLERRQLPDSLIDDVLSGSSARLHAELNRLDASLHARIY